MAVSNEPSPMVPADATGVLQLGPVQLGAMTFGDQVDEHDAATMVDLARDAGVHTFDTSNNYAGGRSEEILGRVIKPFRDEIVLATKVGSPVGQHDPSLVGLTSRAIHRAIDDSLRRLDTDYVDLYYLHRPDPNTPVEESLQAMDDLVRAGKVRHVGHSNYAAWQTTELLYLAERHGWPQIRTSQIMYNLLARRVENEYAACSERFDLFNVVYNPLAGGLLTGKHDPARPPADGTRFTKDSYRERYWNDTQFAMTHDLRILADQAGLTLVELALRWLRDRQLIDSVLLGASGVEQLGANLDALAGPALDDDLVRRCDDATASLAGTAPHYHR